MEKLREIIREFDETICNKANKQNIIELEEKLIDFVPYSELDVIKAHYSEQLDQS